MDERRNTVFWWEVVDTRDRLEGRCGSVRCGEFLY